MQAPCRALRARGFHSRCGRRGRGAGARGGGGGGAGLLEKMQPSALPRRAAGFLARSSPAFRLPTFQAPSAHRTRRPGRRRPAARAAVGAHPSAKPGGRGSLATDATRAGARALGMAGGGHRRRRPPPAAAVAEGAGTGGGGAARGSEVRSPGRPAGHAGPATPVCAERVSPAPAGGGGPPVRRRGAQRAGSDAPAGAGGGGAPPPHRRLRRRVAEREGLRGLATASQ